MSGLKRMIRVFYVTVFKVAVSIGNVCYTLAEISVEKIDTIDRCTATEDEEVELKR